MDGVHSVGEIVNVCDCVCVFVLDSRKCHGISHSNASCLMSAPLSSELSGWKRGTHSDTLRHVDGGGYVDNCQDKSNTSSYYSIYESVMSRQPATFSTKKQLILTYILSIH